MWSNLRLLSTAVLPLLSVLLSAVVVVSEPVGMGWNEHAVPLRARSPDDALRVLEKRLLYCPLTDGYCETGQTCCSYFCCKASTYCVLDLYCSTVDPDSGTSNLPTATAVSAAASATNSGIFGDSTDPASTNSSDSDSEALGSSSSSGGSRTSKTGKKKSGFAAWSTGAKAGLIVGIILIIGIIAGAIVLIACLTCCKTRRQKKKAQLANASPYGGAVDPSANNNNNNNGNNNNAAGVGMQQQQQQQQQEEMKPPMGMNQQDQGQYASYGQTMNGHPPPAPAYSPPPQQDYGHQEYMQQGGQQIQQQGGYVDPNYAQNQPHSPSPAQPLYNESTGGYVAAEKRDVYEAPTGPHQ